MIKRLLLVALLVSGCTGSPSQPATVQSPEPVATTNTSTQLIVYDGGDFLISRPASWSMFDKDKAVTDAVSVRVSFGDPDTNLLSVDAEGTKDPVEAQLAASKRVMVGYGASTIQDYSAPFMGYTGTLVLKGVPLNIYRFFHQSGDVMYSISLSVKRGTVSEEDAFRIVGSFKLK